MNILYLSQLSGDDFAGPTYSVPKQIEAQSKIDNVFWYNTIKSKKDSWKELPYYHDITEFPGQSIYLLPEPFNYPDIIVVELFYNMTTNKLRKELVKGSVPYIIIPRGELTKLAQNRKGLKKKLANVLLCNKYAKRAAAIQYLTEQEYQESGNKWNLNNYVIPNGIVLPKTVKTQFTENGIQCISIGRIEPYQKGLDLLIEACEHIKEQLFCANCQITICGPDQEGKVDALKQQVTEKGLQGIISFRDGVYGEEKEQLLLNSDVFIIPSRFEGHPMALVEAMSYGLPCIATTGTNMRKEIEQYKCGWTADTTSDSISNALIDMINCKDFSSYKDAALYLAQEYDWTNIARRSHEMIQQIVNQKHNTIE